jgi:CRP-like cAMP-binding protein
VISASVLRNPLLRALLQDAGAPAAHSVEFFPRVPAGTVLLGPRAPMTAVYFPVRAVIALAIIMEDGRAIEIATVGNEGIVGLPLLLGVTQQAECAVVQIAGEVARLPAPLLTQALDAHPRVRDAVFAYAHAFIADLMRTQTCVRQHTTQQRCARWLLATHDRIGQDIVPVKPEWLRDALRVSHAGLTGVVRQWERAGLIRHDRRRITIVQRPALERLACACYAGSRT